MHGNDGSRPKGMWFDLMLQLARLNFSCLACDGRGYSAGASPPIYGAYNYNQLVGDIFAIVDKAGFADASTQKFHLVTHDQGARVAWHSIAVGPGRSRYLSFTSLSIPHSDVFSDSIFPSPSNMFPIDGDQQLATMYVRMLVLPNSTTIQNRKIMDSVCSPEGWATPEICQRTLWWYNGAIDAGAMALAPWNTTAPLARVARYVGITKANVVALTQYPLSGVPQTHKVGKITNFPVLYACGPADESDLCKPIFGIRSMKLVRNFTYVRSSQPSCGHQCAQCSDVADAVVKNVLKGEAMKNRMV
jgi:pimeloyl-ACP methyl ester carboxylesterase